MTTLAQLQAYKQRGEKIAMLTCYDASFAKIMLAQGVDALLVGDSLGMVLQGQADTLAVTLAHMQYHTQMVRAGAPTGLIVSDMPVHSYEHSAQQALHNAQQLIAAGADMVKLEGAGGIIAIAQHLTQHGVPVCAHLGFTPQSVQQLGGYKIQGKTPQQAQQMMQDALALQQAGVSALVLEMVPASLAQSISKALHIPTIGIGAGVDCDGQVLVLHDLLGIYDGPAQPIQTGAASVGFKTPRFVKNFLAQHHSIQSAIADYVQSVKQGQFPGPQHSY